MRKGWTGSCAQPAAELFSDHDTGADQSRAVRQVVLRSPGIFPRALRSSAGGHFLFFSELLFHVQGRTASAMRPIAIITLIALTAAISATACQKPAGQDQQTPDSSPTTTSPMNPK